MSQRPSNFSRRANDDYPTPAGATRAIVPYLRKQAKHIWEPAPGPARSLAKVLIAEGFEVYETTYDFLSIDRPPDDRIQALVTNGPHGTGAVTARKWIEYALALGVPHVVLLLKSDFDSGITRVHLFRDCPQFAGRITLLRRCNWFPGAHDNTTNYCWFTWSRDHRGPPTVSYVANEK
jgi:hypothetical protein